MSCSASQQWRVLVCAGFEFQRCTPVPLERVWLRCRGTVSLLRVWGCVDMCFADHTEPSQGCLAEWNVISMGVCVSQGQDTRIMLKCFPLWDPRGLYTPIIIAGWVCEVPPGYTLTPVSPEPRSPAGCVSVSVFFYLCLYCVVSVQPHFLCHLSLSFKPDLHLTVLWYWKYCTRVYVI